MTACVPCGVPLCGAGTTKIYSQLGGECTAVQQVMNTYEHQITQWLGNLTADDAACREVRVKAPVSSGSSHRAPASVAKRGIPTYPHTAWRRSSPPFTAPSSESIRRTRWSLRAARA
mmetsp:Transcript_5827/g.15165  ORF Transcript_5827/g.15165 Transcript_5827/m.15165 type:complete len:117 (-) Transcript_5827:743-1093(-)|eukprot:6915733-Prymnesium_polylepis.2